MNAKTKKTYAERIAAGEQFDVDFGSIGGRIYLDKDYYEDDPHIMYESTYGWAAGVTEPVCEAGSKYLDDEFLKDAITITPVTA